MFSEQMHRCQGWGSQGRPPPPGTGRAGDPAQTLHSTCRPGPGWQDLLAAAVGLADVAEELKGLLRGCAGGGRGGRGRVTRTGPGSEGYSAEGPAVAALQDGDLQGAPGTPHLHREQEQSGWASTAGRPRCSASHRALPTAPFPGPELLGDCPRLTQLGSTTVSQRD